MATTERRRSISVFFGFRQETKPDPMSSSAPKLRRKLQKVTKQTDIEGPSISTGASVSGSRIQTVKIPGDDSFLSTKYETFTLADPDASREPRIGNTRDGKKDKDVAAKDKRVSRDGKPRFFSRSSSTSRVPSIPTTIRPPSSGQAARTTTNKPAHTKNDSVDSAISFGPPSTATANAALTSITGMQTAKDATFTSPVVSSAPISGTSSSRTGDHDSDTTDIEVQAGDQVNSLSIHANANMPKQTAQAASQAAILQLMEAHERASAQERANNRKSFYNNGTASAAVPSPTTPKDDLGNESVQKPLTLSHATSQVHPSREYTQFHRPYRHSQQPATLSQQSRSTQHSSYRSRKSTITPIAVSALPTTVSSHAPSSAVSATSSASLSSPMSAAFSMSSASLSPSSASSFSQSYNTLPLSSPGSTSSCASSPRKFSNTSFAQTQVHITRRSKDHPAPELSYLSHASRQDSTVPDSPASIVSSGSGRPKSRRKVKTPVYAIGQLENANTDTCKRTNNELEKLSTPNHDAPHIHNLAEPPSFKLPALADATAELVLLQSKSSIECIAEEYRALLVSRSSHFTDAQSEFDADESRRPMSSSHNSNSDDCSFSQRESKSLSKAVQAVSPQISKTNIGIDSHLPHPPVASEAFASLFENKTSISQPPPLRTLSSHRHSNVPNYKSPSPPPENISLQICLDLLARELSSAVTHRSSPAAAAAAARRAAGRQQHSANRGFRHPTLAGPLSDSSLAPPPDSAASALQILVMIEAYERLRDRLIADARKKAKKRMARGNDVSAEQIESMFGLWLKALYQIHDTLTYSSEEEETEEFDNTSQSDYDSATE